MSWWKDALDFVVRVNHHLFVIHNVLFLLQHRAHHCRDKMGETNKTAEVSPSFGKKSRKCSVDN